MDLPPVRWDVDVRALYSERLRRGFGVYFGRQPSKTIDDLDDIGIQWSSEKPAEPTADGCPAGWARSPFADSVSRYARRRTKDGNRVESLFIDSDTPWQIRDAVDYLETEQEHWHRHRDEVDADRWNRGPGKPKKG